jgi:hypothetical protein
MVSCFHVRIHAAGPGISLPTITGLEFFRPEPLMGADAGGFDPGLGLNPKDAVDSFVTASERMADASGETE